PAEPGLERDTRRRPRPNLVEPSLPERTIWCHRTTPGADRRHPPLLIGPRRSGHLPRRPSRGHAPHRSRPWGSRRATPEAISWFRTVPAEHVPAPTGRNLRPLSKQSGASERLPEPLADPLLSL